MPAPTRLLDANVLIALFDASHVHHAAARRWFIALTSPFATCPMTEGALVRWIVRLERREGIALAKRELVKLAGDARHRFWPGNLPYTQVNWHGVMGHRQVTDAYLAALARHHHGAIATFDTGLAALHHDVAELISVQKESP